MNCLMCRTPMEREPKKVAGLSSYHCLACGAKASSPVEESVTLSHERAIKAHTEGCNWCGGGTVAFVGVQQIDATLRTAVFKCGESIVRCRCGDPLCKEISSRIPGCGREQRLLESAWPDLEPKGCLQTCFDLQQREEDEEAFAHGSNKGHAER